MAKLKGKNSKRIKPEKKKKMKKTLDKMIETRKEDSINLRDTLEVKLKWAEAEELKAQNQLKSLKAQSLRLQGAILCMKELLEINKKSEEKE